MKKSGISPDYLAKRIVDAKRFIDTNYFVSLDLNKISQSAHFSSFHFLRLFKKTYHKTPLAYLRNRRINQAKSLLEDTDLSVKEICFRVGFDSDASFNILFKKIVGKSPGTYRNWYRKRKEKANQQPLVFIPGCFSKKYHLEE